MDPALHVWFLHLANLVIWLAELVTTPLFGWSFTRGTRREREHARAQYARSAQLVSVVAKASYVPPMSSPRNSAFVFRHLKYVHPQVAVDNKQIVLSHLTATEAYFGLAPEGVDIYDTTKYPFHYLGIYAKCEQYLRMPIASFHRLAEELGDPKAMVAMTAMTLRCGSTLISQVMQRVPHTRSISEPHVVDSLWFLYHSKQISSEELRQNHRSSMRLLLKGDPDTRIDRFFLKFNSFTNPQLGMLKELFPRTKFIMSTRHPSPSIKSMLKLMRVFSTSLYDKTGMLWLRYCFPVSIPRDSKYDSLRGLYYQLRFNGGYESNAALVYASSLACMRESGHIFDLAILYEDVCQRPAKVVEALFKLLEVQENVSVGLAALETDSQNGIFSQAKTTEVSTELRTVMDRCYRDFDLPLKADSSVEEFKSSVNKMFPDTPRVE